MGAVTDLETHALLYDLFDHHQDKIGEHLQGHESFIAARLLELDDRITGGRNRRIFEDDVNDAISCERARHIAYLEWRIK